MPALDPIAIFMPLFNKAGVLYMVTGSIASIIYGDPRLTHDIDLVVQIDTGRIDGFVELFPIDDFYCPPRDIVHVESKRASRGHFNLIHHETGLKADIYIAGTDPLSRWGLSRRKEIEVESIRLWIAPIEYVILRKLEYYREGGSEKHIQDIKGILSQSSNQIDFKGMEQWISRMGLELEWTKCK